PLGRNAAFIGREAALADLARALLPPDGETAAAPAVLVTQAITGLGGVGKTQIAVEFAYRYGYRFRGVHWLDLRDPDLLEEQIARNGEEMGLARGAGEDLAAYARRVLEAWQQDGPRLVILDNLEEVDAARETLRRLRHHTLRLLLTARRSLWPRDLGLDVRPLDIFTPDESRAFLRRYLSPERAADADLDALAERLGHLPLALELAGRYLNYVRTLSVADYLARLEDPFAHPSMQDWKSEWGNPTEHDLNLWATFALSWEQLQDEKVRGETASREQEQNETARRLFRAAAFLAPNAPIPDDILRLVEPDAERRGLALGRLLELGLWREDPEGPVVHPLLVEFARRLAEETPDEGYTFLVALADLARETNEHVDRTGDYALFAPLLPHLRAAAGRGEALAPEVAARLWSELGYHLHALADYAGARACFERALRILEAHLGEEHPNVATLVNNLGSVLQDLGDLAGARACFERALRIDEAVFGPDHPNVARDVNNLGRVLQALGDLAGGRA
ncbi:tetratricopeptide repeat protein, partial [Ardenticatena maritima]